MDHEPKWVITLVDVLKRAIENHTAYGILIGVILGLLLALGVIVKLG